MISVGGFEGQGVRSPKSEHESGPGHSRHSRQQVARMSLKRVHVSQKEFADRYGIPEATLQDWEQHRRKPDAATRSYLRLRRVALQMSVRVW